MHNTERPSRQRTGHSEENIPTISASVTENENVPVPHRSQELVLSRMTTWRILRLDLNLHPDKIVLDQELKPTDH